MRAAPALLVLVVGLLAGPPVPAATAQEDGEAAETMAPRLPEPRLLGPRTGEAREKALKRYGGNAASEKAVERALEWLARHREPGGGWDADGFPSQCEEGGKPCDGLGRGQHGEDVPCPFDAPISALATLAFLARGHVPGAEGDPYGELVEEALESLRGAGGRWGLALATQAFAEAEALERKGRWRADVESGVQALLGQRAKDGAWGYAVPYRPGSDVPYTALVVQALVAARDAGAELPDDLGSGVDAFLNTLETGKGRVAYLEDGRRYGYTPTTSNAHCVAAIRHLLGVGLGGRQHASVMGLVAKKKPVWKISFRERNVPGRGKVRVQVGSLSMYQWWYGTIASFHAGSGTWSGWFGKTKSALSAHQDRIGCSRGSWDPLGTYERQTGGRVFSTALGVLMLTQPYRHRRR